MNKKENDFDEIIKEARGLALKEIEKFGFGGIEIVEKVGPKLADKLNADKRITLLGVYLMDIKLPEAFRKKKIKEHVKMSVEATKEFLKNFDLDEETRKKIINCVEAHHGSVPFICKDAEICANADCYRFLHPKGFLKRLTDFEREMGLEEALNFLESKIDEKYKILSLDICKKELEKYYFKFKEILKVARNL